MTGCHCSGGPSDVFLELGRGGIPALRRSLGESRESSANLRMSIVPETSPYLLESGALDFDCIQQVAPGMVKRFGSLRPAASFTRSMDAFSNLIPAANMNATNILSSAVRIKVCVLSSSCTKTRLSWFEQAIVALDSSPPLERTQAEGATLC